MLFQRAGISRLQRARVLICVPSAITHVEQRAVLEAARRAGAAQTFLIEQPMAAAIGASLPIHEPLGNMIVDIGGGTSEVAVISLGGVVALEAVRVGSFDIDAAIQSYVRREYGLAIGERTAEEVKLAIGSVFPTDDEYKAEVRGRDLMSGMPKTIVLTPEEIREAIDEPIQAILGAVKQALARTPPELSQDLLAEGIHLVGGGAMLRGFDLRIEKETAVRGAARRPPARDGRARRRSVPRVASTASRTCSCRAKRSRGRTRCARHGVAIRRRLTLTVSGRGRRVSCARPVARPSARLVASDAHARDLAHVAARGAGASCSFATAFVVDDADASSGGTPRSTRCWTATTNRATDLRPRAAGPQRPGVGADAARRRHPRAPHHLDVAERAQRAGARPDRRPARARVGHRAPGSSRSPTSCSLYLVFSDLVAQLRSRASSPRRRLAALAGVGRWCGCGGRVRRRRRAARGARSASPLAA